MHMCNSNSISSHSSLGRPQALSLEGTACRDGLKVSIEDYDDENKNTRQHWTLTSAGKIRSVACDGLFIATEETNGVNSDQCSPGSRLVLHSSQVLNPSTWKIGADGTIALDVDCEPYQVPNLVISEIEDDDIDNYENVYFSFINSVSEVQGNGMALSVEGTGCVMNSRSLDLSQFPPVYSATKVTTLQDYNPEDDRQKFKLLKSGNKFIIQSKACAGKEGELLSAINCADENSALVLGPKEVRY